MTKLPKRSRKSGRPRLPPAERRDRIVDIRLNAVEHERLQDKADRAAMPLSTFLRESGMGRRIVGPPSLENQEAAKQLLRVGQLLNQAIKLVNAGKINNVEPSTLKDLREQVRRVRLELRGVKT